MPANVTERSAIEGMFPSSIVEVLRLPVEELKHRIITENGLTVAQEEAILEDEKNPEITHTLRNKEDVKRYVASFMN